MCSVQKQRTKVAFVVTKEGQHVFSNKTQFYITFLCFFSIIAEHPCIEISNVHLKSLHERSTAET